MHGRLKVRTTEEQKKIEREKKEKATRLFLEERSRVIAARQTGNYSRSLLNVELAALHQKAPEFAVFWNFRREILQASLATAPLSSKIPSEKTECDDAKIAKSNNSIKEEAIQKEDTAKQAALFNYELHQTESALKENPKAYPVWHHRGWILLHHPCVDWPAEHALLRKVLGVSASSANQTATHDVYMAPSRNFHAWDHYRFVLAHLNRSGDNTSNARNVQTTGDNATASQVKEGGEFDLRHELDFTQKVWHNDNANFSNLHQRSLLLRETALRMRLADNNTTEQSLRELFQSDLEFVHNCFSTASADQTNWLYYAWLLANWPANHIEKRREEEEQDKTERKENRVIQLRLEEKNENCAKVIVCCEPIEHLPRANESADRDGDGNGDSEWEAVLAHPLTKKSQIWMRQIGDVRAREGKLEESGEEKKKEKENEEEDVIMRKNWIEFVWEERAFSSEMSREERDAEMQFVSEFLEVLDEEEEDGEDEEGESQAHLDEEKEEKQKKKRWPLEMLQRMRRDAMFEHFLARETQQRKEDTTKEEEEAANQHAENLFQAAVKCAHQLRKVDARKLRCHADAESRLRVEYLLLKHHRHARTHACTHTRNSSIDLSGQRLTCFSHAAAFVCMTRVDLSHNALTGSLPWQLNYLVALRELLVMHNQLTSILPAQSGSHTGLQALTLIDASYNAITNLMVGFGPFLAATSKRNQLNCIKIAGNPVCQNFLNKTTTENYNDADLVKYTLEADNSAIYL